MGHDQEDDPGSSCFIKQEPAEEGIYASIRRERTFSEIFGHIETESGLTLQPTIQSSDPQPSHAERSLTTAELEELLWGEPVQSPQQAQRVRSFSPGPARPFYEDEDDAVYIPSQDRSLADALRWAEYQKAIKQARAQGLPDPPAPDLDEGDKSISQTSTVHPDCAAPASLPSKRQRLSDPPVPHLDAVNESTSQTSVHEQSDSSTSASPPGKRQRLSHSPAPRQNQGEQRRLSRTPSPAQSNCFASASQTPGRSETPPTPIDQEVFPDFFGDFGQDEVLPEVQQQQRPLATHATFPNRQDLIGCLQSTVNNAPKPIPVIDLTDELDSNAATSLNNQQSGNLSGGSTAWNCNTPALLNNRQSSTPLGISTAWNYNTPTSLNNRQSGHPLGISTALNYNTSTSVNNQRSGNSLGGSTTWNCNAPVPSIECNQQSNWTYPTTSGNPHGGQPISAPHGRFLPPQFTFRAQLATYIAQKSESRQNEQQHTRTHSTIQSPPTQPDPSPAQNFVTFMKLRNSLPVEAIMAMMAPSNRSQILAALAEVSAGQNQPGATQSTTHALPTEMRAILDNLKQKFNSDKAFMKSVISYASEHLMVNDQSEEKTIDPNNILRIGLDGLSTVQQAREQLFKERAHYHELLSNQERIIVQLKKHNEKLMVAIRPPCPMVPPMPPMVPPKVQSIPYNAPPVVLPPSGPYMSPYTVTPRQERQERTTSPSKAQHLGYRVTRTTQETLRRELPQKEWMKEKQVQSVNSNITEDDDELDRVLNEALDEALAFQM